MLGATWDLEGGQNRREMALAGSNPSQISAVQSAVCDATTRMVCSRRVIWITTIISSRAAAAIAGLHGHPCARKPPLDSRGEGASWHRGPDAPAASYAGQNAPTTREITSVCYVKSQTASSPPRCGASPPTTATCLLPPRCFICARSRAAAAAVPRYPQCLPG